MKTKTITMKPFQSACCGGGFKIKLAGRKGYKKSYYECLICKKKCKIEQADGGKKLSKTLEL